MDDEGCSCRAGWNVSGTALQLVAAPFYGAPEFGDVQFICSAVTKDAETGEPAARVHMHRLDAVEVTREMLRYAPATACVSLVLRQ